MGAGAWQAPPGKGRILGKKQAACQLSPSSSHQALELESFLFGRDDAALERLGAEHGAAAEFDAAAGAVAAAGLSTLEADEGRGLLIYEDRTMGAGAAGAGAAERGAGGTSTSRRPVWEDPDDALLEVNVAAQARLRKLRREEEETVISGGCGAAPGPAGAVAGAGWG